MSRTDRAICIAAALWWFYAIPEAKMIGPFKSAYQCHEVAAQMQTWMGKGSVTNCWDIDQPQANPTPSWINPTPVYP